MALLFESKIFDKNFGLNFDCSKTEAPAYAFTAHMAPAWSYFLSRRTPIPKVYKDSVFIAFHGS